MRNNYKYITAAVLIPLLLIFAAVVSCTPDESEFEFAGTTNFGSVTVTEDITVGDDLVVTDDVSISGDLNADFTDWPQVGEDTAYVIAFAQNERTMVAGTDSITGTLEVTHGLDDVEYGFCTLTEDPTAGAGDGAYCTMTVSGGTVTAKVWQDDFVTAATEVGVSVDWLVIGIESD